MFLKTKEPKAVKAQGLVDQIERKKQQADAKLEEVTAHLVKLGLQLELGDVGLVVTEGDLALTRKARDDAREDVERLGTALVESNRRLVEAQADDAAEALTAVWDAQAKAAGKAREELNGARNALEAARKAIDRYLTLRNEITRACPAVLDRFPGGTNYVELSGLDRLLAARDVVLDFHPRHRMGSLAPSIETLVAQEVEVIDLLTTRHLKIEPAPPPPKPPEIVQGPMLRTGRAA